LLYPTGYINDIIFINALQHEMFYIVDWVIDNNIELRGAYDETQSRDYLKDVLVLDIKPVLYLIRNKKVAITPQNMSHSTNLNLLLLIHFGDLECPENMIVREEYFEQFLSMYPNCVRKKFEPILCQHMWGVQYIDQYLIKRAMLHEEMKLLYDLPDDLCKQIL
jgi:hypothetical protein